MNTQWTQFLADLKLLQDQTLFSIFEQGMLGEWNDKACYISVSWPLEFQYFQSQIKTKYDIWSPLLTKHFGRVDRLFIEFIDGIVISQKKEPKVYPLVTIIRNFKCEDQSIKNGEFCGGCNNCIKIHRENDCLKGNWKFALDDYQEDCPCLDLEQ